MTKITTIATAPPSPITSAPWFARLPVAIFGSVLGIAGLGIAWRTTARVFNAPAMIGESLLLIAAVLFGLLLVLYLIKLVRAPAAVQTEFLHPGLSSFFGTLTIAFTLIAAAALPWSAAVAEVLWAVGTALQAILVVGVFGNWIARPMTLDHVHPGWFILMVGIVVGAPVGVALGHIDVSWACLSLGCLSAAVLYPLILFRLFFHEPLPPALRPTLFILIAPPPLIFLAELNLMHGAFDAFGLIVFFAGLFFAAVVLSRPRLFFGLPFAVSWWAYTFPLDALTIATLNYHEHAGHPVSAALALALLMITTVIVALVATRSLIALSRKSLF
jgi:tellurite resistance protein